MTLFIGRVLDVCDIELITVSQREYKVDMIRAIATSRNVPILNCTLIDDMQATIREAATIGIKTLRTVSVCEVGGEQS